MQEAATLLPKNELRGFKPGFGLGANAVFKDAFDDEEGETAPSPVASELQEIVPIPVPADTSKLEDEASRHRVLLVRGGAVIALTTIIAVGGALLIHAIFAGLIILGSFFPWFQGTPATSGGSGANADAEKAGGFSMLGAGPDDNAAPSPNPVYTAGTPDAGLSATTLPPLKPLPETTSRDLSAQFVAQSTAPELPASNFGSVRVPPPKNLPPTAAALNETSLAPPQVGSGTVAGTPGSAARGTASGDGGGIDDEPVFNWVKGGGTGSGRGSGAGNGIDRGMSAADRPAQILNFGGTDFDLPMKYQIKPPQQSVKLIVTVDADARVIAVKLDQSCGIKDIDDLVTAWARTLRFSPAYKAGKAVTSDFPLERSFGAF